MGWGTVQTLLGANKYSCILIHTISYPYIHTYIHTTDHVTPQYVATNLQFVVKTTVQTLLVANKYSCILIRTISYPYIHTYIHTTDHVTPHQILLTYCRLAPSSTLG